MKNGRSHRLPESFNLSEDGTDLEILYRTGPSGLTLLDRDLRILRINDYLVRTTGLTAEQQCGKPLRQVLPQLAALIEPHLKRVFDTGESVVEEYVEASTPLNPEESRSWIVTAHPLRLENGVIAAINTIVHDRTDHKKRERERKVLLEFEHVIAELSAEFVNLPADRFEHNVRDGLARVGEFLDADRVWLMLFDADKTKLPLAYWWFRSGFEVDEDTVSNTDMAAFPALVQLLFKGHVFRSERVTGLEAGFEQLSALFEQNGIKSGVAIPMSVGEDVIGALAIDAVRQERHWPDELVRRVKLMADVFANVISRKRADEDLRASLRQVESLRDRLEAENAFLREEIHDETQGDIIGVSSPIKAVLSLAERVAATDSTVLLLGETGTGKELISKRIHELSSRRNRALVTVNCAALPNTMIESELFGREKGAYTGALSRQAGRFEIADGSTLFLDEVGELSLETQVKLLRVLQSGEFERLGSTKISRVDVRVIAATNRELMQAVNLGTFRRDLFYRLNVFPITIPPLRDRKEDIPLLVWHFVRLIGKRLGKLIESIDNKSMANLSRYDWPGNIREIINTVERALIMHEKGALVIDLPHRSKTGERQYATLDDLQRNRILEVLEQTHWTISGSSGAARILGLKPSTLYNRMKKFGISRDERRS